MIAKPAVPLLFRKLVQPNFVRRLIGIDTLANDL